MIEWVAIPDFVRTQPDSRLGSGAVVTHFSAVVEDRVPIELNLKVSVSG